MVSGLALEDVLALPQSGCVFAIVRVFFEVLQIMNDRQAAVMEFSADPAHRRMSRIVVAVVVLAITLCVACIWSLPTKYCNYLVPTILGCSVVSLILVARRYVSRVTVLLERHGLICEHCGCSTIPRPDEIVLRTSDGAFGTEVCYNCDIGLLGD